MQNKKWFLGTMIGTIGVLVIIALTMIIVDPYFHYHKPLEGLSYRLYFERYINRGIADNFEYDAMITGTSMNQNFKTSTMGKLFGTNAVKTTFSGAGYEEISQQIQAACDSDNELKTVVWGIDYNGLRRDYDWKQYKDYPTYLYDDNLLNDVSYLFNKSILFHGLLNTFVMTLTGQETTTFDEYSSWEGEGGLDNTFHTYIKSEEKLPMEEGLSEEEKEMVIQNVQANLVDLANKNPETEFLLFYTPYSILYWESIYRDGTLLKQLEAEQIATEMLLECENIKLYSFSEQTDITTYMDNYRDKEHYIAEINDIILQWIHDDVGRVTRENYKERLAWEEEFFMGYDYDTVYGESQEK